MDLKCKLVKKTFTTENGEVREYYVLEFLLANDEKLEITIKKDKAQLILLSQKVIGFPEKPFWSPEETNSLN